MPINPARYAIITNEYRHISADDATIAARYKKARSLELDTSLKNATNFVTGLLNGMFGVIGAVRRRFEVYVVGTTAFNVDQMSTDPLGVLLTLPEYQVTNLPCIVTRMVIDEEDDTTILEVWG